jgi:hypothetical protein
MTREQLMAPWIRRDKATGAVTGLSYLDVYAKLYNGRFYEDVHAAMAMATAEQPVESPWAIYFPRIMALD